MKNIQQEQLMQVIEYAEIIVRIEDLLEMLDPKGGYMGEEDIFNQLKEVQQNIKKHLIQHLNNADISRRAMTIVNNMIVCPEVFRR